MLENVEPTEEYIEWVEAAAAEFGMDWCALDVMVGVDGNHYIIGEAKREGGGEV